jgi:hypothetical protein
VSTLYDTARCRTARDVMKLPVCGPRVALRSHGSALVASRGCLCTQSRDGGVAISCMMEPVMLQVGAFGPALMTVLVVAVAHLGAPLRLSGGPTWLQHAKLRILKDIMRVWNGVVPFYWGFPGHECLAARLLPRRMWAWHCHHTSLTAYFQPAHGHSNLASKGFPLVCVVGAMAASASCSTGRGA